MLKAYGRVVRDTLIPKRSLRIGEIVRVKPLKVVESVRRQGLEFNNGFIRDMYKFCGKVGRITEINKKSFCGYSANSYRIDIDGERWWWNAHMFDWENKGIMETE